MRHAYRSSFMRYFHRNYDMYILLIPGLAFLLLFKYLPLTGNVIAFKQLNLFAGDHLIESIWKSPWAGWDHFERAFRTPGFSNALANTFIISFYKLIFLFPLPIIIALLLNELKNIVFKRTVQTVIYFPHFMSWVIIASLFVTLLNSGGVVNSLLESLGFEKIKFLMSNAHFRSVLVIQEGWKETGWGTIVYLAAIAGINPELYESAVVDGASRYQKALHITLPGIASTIVLLFILRMGNILEAGFEQIFVMYNPLVYDTADIIGTFVYRIGLGQMDFSFATAVGMFESAVGFSIIIAANFLCRRFLDRSIW